MQRRDVRLFSDVSGSVTPNAEPYHVLPIDYEKPNGASANAIREATRIGVCRSIGVQTFHADTTLRSSVPKT